MSAEIINWVIKGNDSPPGYPLLSPFDPDTAYCESGSKFPIDPRNHIYGLVCELFIKLGLDLERVGSRDWNPLTNLIKPGDRVLIKPNLVTHTHYLGEKALYGSVTHGSVLRPLVDYAWLAMEGRGKIIIGDNPVEGADFDRLIAFTGIRAMVEELRCRGCQGLELIDLRPQVLREERIGRFVRVPQEGDPLGYVEVDLGSDSCFAELDAVPGIHYYTLADPTVDHFDPRCIIESRTDAYHRPGRHTYLVSRSILQADVIINVAKMKTHCKAGVSLALKNMIGMVYQKDCMPHHRPGVPPLGDSFPHYPAVHYTVARKAYRGLRERVALHRWPGFRLVRNLLQKRGVLIGKHVEHGNWYGNDTIWRTILDLNRIVLYADREGRMCDKPQRRLFCLIDGIVAQEGDGPMSGEPKNAGLLVGSYNPVLADALATRLMGIDTKKIITISKAKEIHRWPLLPFSNKDLTFEEQHLPNLNFRLPKGWN